MCNTDDHPADMDWRSISSIDNGKRWINKPMGGLWTSEMYKDTSEFYAEWHERGIEMHAQPNSQIWRLAIDVHTNKICTIDTYEDLKDLVNRYPRVHPTVAEMLNVDFESIFKTYDVIHLTSKGQWATRLEYPHSLHGWDTECWLWNNTANIRDVELVAKAVT
jgi:hypothetical protein